MSRRTLGLTGLALAAAGILAWGGQALVQVWQMTQEVAALEREIVQLRQEADRLAAQVDRLRSDPEAIERVAREDLGLVKPGERVLKLPPGPPSGGR